jgi:hypothetical protein
MNAVDPTMMKEHPRQGSRIAHVEALEGIAPQVWDVEGVAFCGPPLVMS